jgi:hypothetical protein
MAENQIQFVLNPRAFIGDKDLVNGFGPNKDYFVDRDNEFVAHKRSLVQGLVSIGEASRTNAYSRITYAKVKMRSDAIAKTHRPTKSIFTVNKRSYVVGGAGVGELLIEMYPGSIEKTVQAIDRAEDETQQKPSRARSEVGGIQSIQPYSSEDRVPFTLAEVTAWKQEGLVSNGYYVDLFHPLYALLKPMQLPEDFKSLLQSFKDNLESLSYVSYKELMTSGRGGQVFVHIESDSEEDYAVKNAELLDFLSGHPLVRKVSAAPSLSSFTYSEGLGLDVDVTAPNDISDFPIIGVIDNGISDVFDGWKVYKWSELPDNFRVEDHGSKVAGLLVKGNALNGEELVPETDGCRLADLCVFPSKGNWSEAYPLGAENFFESLKNAVKDAKDESGVRIFNISMNQEGRIPSEGWYSVVAKKLDEIADELDVQFVISAGNLPQNRMRGEWIPADPEQNIDSLLPEHLALPPAESLRGISVMALNPNDQSPTAYTLIGSAYQAGVKPDVAYIGGSAEDNSGLSSVNMTGQKILVRGTSMSAPLVAKIMSSVDNKIGGNAPLELLKALLIHHAQYPEAITDKVYDEIRKNLYGFGVPASSEIILTEDDHSFTFVVADSIPSDKKLSLSFPWPASLKRPDGKCRGEVKLTLVSRPILDDSFGEEMVRENITAYLRAGTADGRKKGLMKFVFTDVSDEEPAEEENLIKDAFKWNPVKVSHATLKRKKIDGDVFLEIEYLSREGLPSNFDGVPFAAILTISDPKGEAQVNRDMKAALQSIGVQLSDIQVAAQVRGRI